MSKRIPWPIMGPSPIASRGRLSRYTQDIRGLVLRAQSCTVEILLARKRQCEGEEGPCEDAAAGPSDGLSGLGNPGCLDVPTSSTRELLSPRAKLVRQSLSSLHPEATLKWARLDFPTYTWGEPDGLGQYPVGWTGCYLVGSLAPHRSFPALRGSSLSDLTWLVGATQGGPHSGLS